MASFYRVVGQNVDEPNVDSLDAFLTSFDVANEVLGHTLESFDDQLAESGFVDPLCYAIGVDDAVHIVQVVWRHESGRAFARMFVRVPRHAANSEAAETSPVNLAVPDFVTCFDDETFTISTASASRTIGPAGCMINQFIGASIEVLWNSHQRKLAVDHRQVELLKTDDALMDAVEDYHELWRDSLVNEGVFVEVTDTEDVELIVTDSADEIVLAEMRQQSEKQSGSGMALLFISIVLFSAVEPAGWNLEFLALLIPIILFHEAGHFITMKLFGYRNLKMFFIPFLGAAVTGRQYNVPGWKQVIVSLAGPLPGIALGGVLLIVAQFWPHDYLKTAITQLVLINALNLLPILPLDGGWVAQTLVFSRHPILAAAFKAVAIICLFATGVAEGSFLFPMIGLSMLIGLPMGYRVEQIGRKLRKEGLASPLDDDSIPDETGLRIVQELRAVAPAATTPQTLATLGLTAFERVNARPPGVLASVFFAGVQAVSLIAALLIATLANWQGMQAPMEKMEEITEAHKGEISCNEIVQFPAERDPNGARRLIVASYADPQVANFRREGVAGELSATCEFLVIGRAVIASELETNPDSIEQLKFAMLTDALHSFEADVDFGLSGTLICEAPDEETAAQLQAVLNGYFDSEPGTHLIPPWSPAFEITAEQESLRKLHYKYRMAGAEAIIDPRIQQLWKEQGEPADDTPEAVAAKRDETMTRQQELLKEIVDEKRKSITGQLTTDAERQLIAAIDKCQQSFDVAEIDDDDPAYREALASIGAMLGQLPLVNGSPIESSKLHSSGSGFASTDGLTLHISFAESFHGDWLIPALADWLCDSGCRLTKYEIDPAFNELDMIGF
jgi:Zn-dependent protease